MEECERYLREYLHYMEERGGDEQGRRAAWERMGRGSAWYHGRPVAFSYVPCVYGPREHETLAHIAHAMYGILRKAMRAYSEDQAFRREFRFDPRVQELVLLPSLFDEPLPFARVDMLWDERTGAFTFVECNTDASSGMNETREACAALRAAAAEGGAFASMCAAHALETDQERQFAGWVRTYLGLLEQSGRFAVSEQGVRFAPGTEPCMVEAGEPQRPRMAIVACLDSPQPDELGELEEYRRLFEAAGLPCSVFDVRQLSYDGTQLWGGAALSGESNVPIHCVWRYCIMVDMLQNWDKVQPFIQAVREGAVVMAGAFSTQVVHDKQLFAVLHGAAAQALLTLEEQAFVRAHIPHTVFLDDPALDPAALKAQRERWVIKPVDWYASIDVVVGRSCDQAEWEMLVDERVAFTRQAAAAARVGASAGEDAEAHAGATAGAGEEAGATICAGADAVANEARLGEGAGADAPLGCSPFIAQEFCAPYRTPVVPLYGDEGDFTAQPRAFGNILGMFLFAGEFAGVYVRQGPHDVIGSAREGLVAPVFWADAW